MAGPAPKKHRQHRMKPTHGEYVRLEPLKKPVLEKLGDRHTPLAKAYWEAWRQDPVTATWTPTEVALALHVLELIDTDPVDKAAEIRIRIDGLALSPKGRRDARLLLPDEDEPEEDKPAEPTPLRVLPEAK